MSDLRALFEPRSIAVFGASPDQTKLSGRPLGSLKRYRYGGDIYPINPKYTEIESMRCYASIAEVPGEVDLAVIPVGSEQAVDVVEQCAAKGVRAAIILTSGFAETGSPAGIALQERLRQVAERSGMRLIGPNSMGMINFHNGAAANFSSTLFRTNVTPGSVGFVSQSGALGAMLFDLAADQGIHYAGWLSTGNEVDVQFGECLLHLVHDQRVKVIGGYMEGLRDGPRFLQAAREALAAGKPLALLKAGRSATGSQAALSHTGALSGSAAVFDAVFEQFGILGTDNPVELLDLLLTFERCPLPRGRRAAIVTFSGGAGTIIADKCAELGLQTPELSPATRARLAEVLPAFSSTANPVDLTAQVDGDPSLLGKALAVLADEPDIDLVLVFLALLKRFPEELSAGLTGFGRAKPLLATWMAGPSNIVRALADAGVAAFPDPIRMVKAAAGLTRYASWRAQGADASSAPAPQSQNTPRRAAPTASAPPAAKPVRGAPPRNQPSERRAQRGSQALTEAEAKNMLASAGWRTPRGRVVSSAAEAQAAARELGGRVAMKISSRIVLHKTDAGLVKLAVEDPAATFEDLLSRGRELDPDAEVLVEEMLPPGLEMAVGISRDPVFGPVLMVAFGGTGLEVDPDRALALPPISRTRAEAMLRRLRGFARLQGIRGGPPLDVEALIDAMVAVAALAETVQELDVNPLFVYPHGVIAADALIVRCD